MQKRFFKFHGAGNDFIIVEPTFFGLSNQRSKSKSFTQQQEHSMSLEIKNLCVPHFGVGADGVLILSEAEDNGYKMSVYNGDSSYAPMCGNGLRCAAVYLFKKKNLKNTFIIHTDRGEKEVTVQQRSNYEYQVKTNLGKVFNIQKYHQQGHMSKQGFATYFADSLIYTCEIGNKHIIVFMTQQKFQLLKINNAYLQMAIGLRNNQPYNVNFCFIDVNKDMKIATCEIGAGLTFACGTGSAASVFTGYHIGLLNQCTKVQTRGGILIIEAMAVGNQQYEMIVTGPAKYVCTGLLEEHL